MSLLDPTADEYRILAAILPKIALFAPAPFCHSAADLARWASEQLRDEAQEIDRMADRGKAAGEAVARTQGSWNK